MNILWVLVGVVALLVAIICLLIGIIWGMSLVRSHPRANASHQDTNDRGIRQVFF